MNDIFERTPRQVMIYVFQRERADALPHSDADGDQICMRSVPGRDVTRSVRVTFSADSDPHAVCRALEKVIDQIRQQPRC